MLPPSSFPVSLPFPSTLPSPPPSPSPPIPLSHQTSQQAVTSAGERTVLEAEKKGVKVLALGAISSSEALDVSGQAVVDSHKGLRVRVVQGNTLTAAVVVNELRPDCKEVFMTGATSKLGRAIGLHLASKKGVRVMMMTNSVERFEKIQSELPEDKKHLLVRVESAEAAKNCNTWIAGKWLTEKEQSYAPPGTHFHQFVVPPIEEYRKDCTYGLITQIYLPKDTKNLHFCMVREEGREGGRERGVEGGGEGEWEGEWEGERDGEQK